jgi:vitamin B12 transporter
MAGVAVTVGRGVEVFGRVTNLFDQSYEEVFGYPAPGRAGMIGIRVAGSR